MVGHCRAALPRKAGEDGFPDVAHKCRRFIRAAGDFDDVDTTMFCNHAGVL
jgi:hypothetical protein